MARSNQVQILFFHFFSIPDNSQLFLKNNFHQ